MKYGPPTSSVLRGRRLQNVAPARHSEGHRGLFAALAYRSAPFASELEKTGWLLQIRSAKLRRLRHSVAYTDAADQGNSHSKNGHIRVRSEGEYKPQPQPGEEKRYEQWFYHHTRFSGPPLRAPAQTGLSGSDPQSLVANDEKGDDGRDQHRQRRRWGSERIGARGDTTPLASRVIRMSRCSGHVAARVRHTD